jgi:hypothetical protein
MPRATAAHEPVDDHPRRFDNTPGIIGRLTFPQRGDNVENRLTSKTIPTIRAVF